MFKVMRYHYRSIGNDMWAITFEAIPGVLVTGMEEAKRRYGGAPILEWCGGAQ